GVLGWMLLGERVAPRTWLAMGVALVGAVVMVSDSYSRGAIAGALLAIVMAASFATATVLVRRHPEIQMAPAAALATALTALVALPFADPLETGPRVIESDLLKQLEAQTPLGRIGQPRDSAPGVAFLASGGTGWITGAEPLTPPGTRLAQFTARGIPRTPPTRLVATASAATC